MKGLYELHKKYLTADKRYENKQSKLNKQIAELEKQRDKMRYPHFMDFLNKLGTQILPKIKGAVTFEINGPFGMSHECSIWFYGPGSDDLANVRTKKARKLICGATFRRYGDGYGLKDYSKKTNDYPKGSLGELNGGNYRTIEISKDMNIDWFIKFMKKK